MFPSKIETCTYILTLFAVFLLTLVNGQDRKITSESNPGCENCKYDDVLMYIRAEGAHDTIHQIWDFTGGVPTVILAVSSVNSTMKVKWLNRTPSHFEFSEKVIYSFGIAFDALYVYNDVNDKGYILMTDPYVRVPLAGTEWRLAGIVQVDEEVMVEMHGTIKHKNITGVMDVRLDFLPFKDYAVQLPHLIHTANSSLLDVALVNVTAPAEWRAARLALRGVLVASDPARASMRTRMRKSLDDEHTPGTFEITEIQSPTSYNGGLGGYLQFRPVAYTRQARDVEVSTVLHVSEFNRTYVHTSTMEAFYREFDKDNLLAQSMLVSFGEPEDGFYRKHNYTSWSLSAGCGAPPAEGFSTFVLAVIGAGLGLPLLLALAGALYLCARRRRPVPHARLDH